MQHIIRVGTSAGGARAKAVIAWNEETGEIRSGQVSLHEGFGHWLIKFDDVSNNGTKKAPTGQAIRSSNTRTTSWRHLAVLP